MRFGEERKQGVVVWERFMGRQRLHRVHSSCRRCEATRPTAGRVLWAFVKQRLRFQAIANYWMWLGHHPRYAATHAAAAMEDLGDMMQ